MHVDIATLSPSLVARLSVLLAEAEHAGCTSVSVSLDTSKGFAACLEWEGRLPWSMEAHEFNYLVGHMRQTIREQQSPLHEGEIPAVLAQMPDVGHDEDFARAKNR